MTAQAVVAGIAALAAIFVAVVNYVAKRNTDRENARLMTEHDEVQAQREYDYNARQRLYEQFQPVSFQLVESSESAYWRIVGLAASAHEERLTPGTGRLRLDSRTYLPSTVYRLFAPLAVLRLCQQRLTVLDLSLDPEIQRQYLVAKAVYRTWSDGPNLASSGAVPLVCTESEMRQQNLGLQHVERMIEGLVTLDESTNAPRCLTYGEFSEAYHDKASRLHAPVERILKKFVDFHPRTHPVLWRILITQASLFGYLAYSSQGRAIDPLSAISAEERKRFDWRTDREKSDGIITTEDAIERPFSAAHDYLVERLPSTRRVLWQGKSEGIFDITFVGSPVETRYVLTTYAVERQDGILGNATATTEYPLWAIGDVRVSQSLRQKARRIGTVTIDLDGGGHAGPGHIELRDIREFRKVCALVKDLAQSARRDHLALRSGGADAEIV